MKAIQFDAAIPRYALGKVLGGILPGFYWSGLTCMYQDDIPEPSLIDPTWVKIHTLYGGICGSDLGTISLHTSPYYSPFSSFPFTLGHENVGTIAETGSAVEGWQAGDRVVVEPHLWCAPRGFETWCPACSRGETNHCEHITKGKLAPGIITGACKDTGGSWSSCFLAHQSQLYKVPDSISNENALMVEPFACGVHAALQHFPKAGETVLVQGAGTIGLCTLAALRALGADTHVIVSARYPFQAEAAQKLGADEVILHSETDFYTAAAEKTGAKLYKPIIGKRVVSGGFDRVFECVGSDSSIDDAIRLARSGGTVVLVGVPGIARGIDWTAIFEQELSVHGSATYHHAEQYQGETWRTFDLAFHLLSTGKTDLSWLVTHQYRLDDYKKALKDSTRRGSLGMIKSVFAFQS